MLHLLTLLLASPAPAPAPEPPALVLLDRDHDHGRQDRGHQDRGRHEGDRHEARQDRREDRRQDRREDRRDDRRDDRREARQEERWERDYWQRNREWHRHDWRPRMDRHPSPPWMGGWWRPGERHYCAVVPGDPSRIYVFIGGRWVLRRITDSRFRADLSGAFSLPVVPPPIPPPHLGLDLHIVLFD